MKLAAFVASTAGLLATLPAAGACSWEWLCNGEGRCKQMPVCDSVRETPPPRPEGAQPPAAPPLKMRPYRITGTRMAGIHAAASPPLTCEHIMRQERNGRWKWHEACFCADPERGGDSTPPFANIVRCDAR